MSLRFCFSFASSVRAAVGVAIVSALASSSACGGDKFTAASTVGNDGGDSDASADAGVDDSSTSGFCANLPGKHYFCDDFDHGTVKAGWDTQAASRVGNVVIDNGASKSAPRSLEVYTSHGATNEETYALLQKDIGAFKSLVIELDALVDSYGGEDDSTALMALTLGDLQYGLTKAAPQGAVFAERLAPDGGAAQQFVHALSAGLAQGAWVHVKITLTLPQATSAGHIVIAFDAQTVLDTSLTILATPGASGSLALGLHLYNAPSLWKVHYDNVVLDKG